MRANFGTSVVDGFTQSRELPVSLTTSENAYEWDWFKVTISGGEVTYPTPTLKADMDGQQNFSFVLKVTIPSGTVTLNIPSGTFKDIAGRDNVAFSYSVTQSPAWAKSAGTVSTATSATTIGASAVTSGLSSFVASASGSIGQVGAGAGGGAAGGVAGAGASSLGFVGPAQLASVLQGHMLVMIGHVQMTGLLGAADFPLPQGFREFSANLKWTTLQVSVTLFRNIAMNVTVVQAYTMKPLYRSYACSSHPSVSLGSLRRLPQCLREGACRNPPQAQMSLQAMRSTISHQRRTSHPSYGGSITPCFSCLHVYLWLLESFDCLQTEYGDLSAHTK